jgi:hypothetical protein
MMGTLETTAAQLLQLTRNCKGRDHDYLMFAMLWLSYHRSLIDGASGKQE